MKDKLLDLRGLLCPLPVIKTQNQIRHMQPGEQLKILCTDPGAIHDIPAWCRVHQHTLISAEKIEREIVIVIEVG